MPERLGRNRIARIQNRQAANLRLPQRTGRRGGRPYFVMELVDGSSIDEFCQQHDYGARERLELFCEVCLAVHHAHQKGILHRDLKPSNILVGLVDGRAVPKIIDFGIAKAIHGATDPVIDTPPDATLAQSGVTTVWGDVGQPDSPTTARQLIGTPEYMSPEQVVGDCDIDTRADVFALGGVLYRLLVGISPLETRPHRNGGLKQLARAISENTPARPSDRLRAKAAGSEGVRAVISPTALEGDLDAIVMKALAKDRAGRYESAAELAHDIERHLAYEPVLAGPATARYRASKFLRRNRVWVLATSLVFVALVGGTISALVGFLRADRARRSEADSRRHASLEAQIAEYQRKIADEERKAAEVQRQLARAKANEAIRVAAMLDGMVAGASPREGKGVDFTMRHQLDEFAESLEGELTGHPEVEARLRRTVGRAYLDLIEISKAGPHLQRALELRLQLFDPEHASVLESRIDYAGYLISDSRMDEAEREVKLALPALRRGPPTDTLIRAVQCLSRFRRAQEEYTIGSRLEREAWDLATTVHGPQHHITLDCQRRAGVAAFLAGRFRKDEEALHRSAELLMREALQQLQTVWPQRRFEIGLAKVNLARLLIWRDEVAEAKQLVQEVVAQHRDDLGPDSKHLVADLRVMSKALMAEEDFRGAEEVAREAVEIAERVTDERERIRAEVFHQMSLVLDRERPEEAVDWHTRAIDAWHACLGNHPTVAIQRRRLAGQLRSLGRWREAEQCFHQAMEVLKEHPNRKQGMGITHHRLADLLRAAGHPERAVTHLRQAVSLQDPATIFSVVARIDHIETLLDIGNTAEAEKQSQDWLGVAEETAVPLIEFVSQASEAQLLMAAGQAQRAEEILQRTLGKISEDAPRMRSRVAGLLADCPHSATSF